MAKPWEKSSVLRKGETRSTRKVLILCEDQKTAPYYFRKFPFDPSDVLIEAVGTGTNTIGLVREAIRRKDEAESRGERFIAVWCVFDRDDFPAQNFNAAFDMASSSNVRIAYANQCFELWYWLHFDLQQTSVSRDEYAAKLSIHLKRKYHKADLTLYNELKPHQPDAIRNSKKLLSFYGARNPEGNDPSTTVHVLVEYLNEFEP